MGERDMVETRRAVDTFSLRAGIPSLGVAFNVGGLLTESGYNRSSAWCRAVPHKLSAPVRLPGAIYTY